MNINDLKVGDLVRFKHHARGVVNVNNSFVVLMSGSVVTTDWEMGYCYVKDHKNHQYCVFLDDIVEVWGHPFVVKSSKIIV